MAGKSGQNGGHFVWTLAVLEAVALGGMLLPGGLLVALWVSLLGFIMGGTFGLALTLLVLRAPDTESASQLSGMSQSVGYFVAAIGPPVFGYQDVGVGAVGTRIGGLSR